MSGQYPMKLIPCYKDYLWGGTKLKELYGKDSGFTTTAESWELSCHEDGMCIVENGTFHGRTLGEVLTAHPEYTGVTPGRFPILVKLIDADQDLSIQVHPSDATARTELGESGKAEMWYVVDAKPHSFLYCGLRRRITPEQLIASAQGGMICKLLNRVPVKRGDIFLIRPGTIHAIGKGLLIAEIQQNSNTTFRLYDYLRQDKNGRPRPLHLKRASEVADLTPIVPQECRLNCRVQFPEYQMTQMFSCDYFDAYKLEVLREIQLYCSSESFFHLLVVEGSGILRTEGKQWRVHAGDSWFLPAGTGNFTITGQCTALLSKRNKGAYDR